MLKLMMGILPVVCAFGADKKPPAQYPNTHTVSVNCDTAWGKALGVFIRSGFQPATSDKAGGILTFTWTRGEMSGATANREAKQFTLASHGALTTFQRLRVDTTSAIFSADGGGCRIQITIAYAVLKTSLAQGGWVAVPSNGLLESKILEGIDGDLKK